MDDNQLRTLGLAGGGAAMAVALALTVIGGKDGAQTPTIAADPATPPPVSAPAVSPSPSGGASVVIPPSPIIDTASADGPPRPVAVVKPAPVKASAPPQNPNLEFLVRFDTRHPLSAAQDLWLQGKHPEAEALARTIAPQRAELRGLCFSRFTLGAELVFAHCTRVPRAQIQRTSERWQRKLRATPGVQYCDANVIADVESK